MFNNIGVVELKPNTSIQTKRRLEKFFIDHDLFLGWKGDEKGIVVSDVDKAKELIRKVKNDLK